MNIVLASFAEAAKLFERTAAVEFALESALHRIGAHVEKVAKEEIGEYQPAVGPFPAWAPLSEYTLNGWGKYPGKIQLGYAPPDNPLLREGDLRDSIEYHVDHLEVSIGSDDDRMVYHELGTARMPPRPVLGPAVFRSKHVIEKLVGAALAVGLVGGEEAAKLLDFGGEEAA